MNRLFESLRPFIRAVVRHAGWVLAVAVLASAVGGYYALRLPDNIDTDISKLIPQDRPTVQALEKLRETVGGESDVAVGIVSPSFEANKAFAEALIPKALDMKRPTDDQPYLTRVEYKRKIEFLQNNALYFATDNELDRVEQFLDEKIEEAKLEANPFYFDLGEEDAGPDTTAQELEQMYDRLVGKRYPVSDDSTTMVVRFYPSGSNSDIGYIENLYDNLRDLVDRINPKEYHPEMEVVLAGRVYRRLVEATTIQEDVASSFGAGVLSVILLVVAYFLYKAYRARTGGRFKPKVLAQEVIRTPVLALIIAVPLFMSLLWTGGVAYLLFGGLNLMTSTLGLILFGLGIDFGIHFYGRYAEERTEGHAIVDAAETTFISTGQAIAIGALTTAAALFVLTAADFKGFSEFGAIAGTGILFALISMTVVMPALIAVLERLRLVDLEGGHRTDANHGPAASGKRYPGARPIVIGSVVAVVAAIVFLPRVGFQYDFGALEPEYTEYKKKDEVVERVGSSGGERRNPAYVIADSPEDVTEIVAAVRQKMEADTTSPTILAVESLQERFPLNDAEQQAKLQRIAQIRQTLSENQYLKDADAPRIQQLRQAAQTRSPIAIGDVPEYLQKKFTTRDGNIGTFVMIYPSVGLSDGRNSIAFKKDVGTITTESGKTYHAASTSLVAADMLLIMQSETPWMIGAAFLIITVLMFVNFRSIRWAALALIPLGVGLLWMLLLMEVFGIMLNFYNMIVLPAVMGIGNDDGVHMVHRYKEEGAGSIRAVLRSTGEHVVVGNLTTALGFGGLVLSFHPGLNSIGQLAVVGFGTTLAAALIFLPALLQWLEDRDASPAGTTARAPESRPASAVMDA
jgi:predicted RND superfamily exporter protein